MKVIIVGAGVGGLITALRLHQEGIDCTIYEQTKRIRELGVGINLLPNAVKQLARLDLLDRLHETGIRTHELIYSHRLGQKIMDRPCGIAAGFTLPQFSIHRGRLQGLLHRAVIERLGSDAVRTGHRLTGFNQATNAVHAHFAGPGGTAIAKGDVLVGADGIHSTVRATLFPQEGTPRWNGVTMWCGATDWPEFGTGRTMLIAGGQAKLVVYPIAEGQTPGAKLTNWVLCAPTGQAGDPPPERQDWARRGHLACQDHRAGRLRVGGAPRGRRDRRARTSAHGNVSAGHDRNRSTVGVMIDLARLAEIHHDDEPDVDLIELSVRLARTPCSPLYKRQVSPDRELAALLHAMA